jgi:hydrogenase maturation protein HypF
VLVEIQGPESRVQPVQERLSFGPESARIESVQVENRQPEVESEFVIRPSARESTVPPCPPTDRAPCAECLAEFRSPRDRRGGYPFINCPSCGPRFTLLRSMPFDRDNTSMTVFPLCDRCRDEYSTPVDRRFHAQVMACPDCGPRVSWVEHGNQTLCDAEAVDRARRTLQQGGIIALKGVGGFHLVCKATDETAVARLRRLKHRPARPLALMASTLGMVRKYAEVNDLEAQWLESPARPIVLTRSRDSASETPLASSVAPGVNTLGFMLPYTPLHEQLIDDSPLVMTSGNRSGEPLIYDSGEAIRVLAPLVDGVLDHNRRIEVRCDDSVMQVVQAAPRMIRRSRGFVPEPLKLRSTGPCVLAVGGEFKAAPALAVGDRVYPGPHVGDLESWPGLQALEESATHLCRVLLATPEAIACDAHAGYLSHRWARESARKRGIPCVEIHHHEAHAASWQVDADREDAPALAVVFDGTGVGRDHTLWGSDFFFLPGENPAQRLAAFEPVPLPGGELAVRKPARMALAFLLAAGLGDSARLPCVRSLPDRERRLVRLQIERRLHSPLTRGVGRLFDAVSSLLGVCQEATYEGQPAIELEAMAEQSSLVLPGFQIEKSDAGLRISPAPLVRGIVAALESGEDARRLSYAFHVAVVEMIVTVLRDLRQSTATSLVGFSGGVFQNRLLVDLLSPRLRAEGFEPSFHTRLPCNDGGLAVGQAVLARRLLPKSLSPKITRS